MKLSFDNIRLTQKGFLLVIVPLVFEVLLLGTLVVLLRNAEAEAQQATRSKEIMMRSEHLIMSCYLVGTSIATYKITHDPKHLEQFDALSKSLPRQVKELKDLVASNPTETEQIRKVGLLTSRAVEELADIKEMLRNDQKAFGLYPEHNLIKKLRRLLEAATISLGSVSQQEGRTGTSSQLEAHTARDLLYRFLAGAFVANILLAVGLAAFFNASLKRRLFTVVDNTLRLTKRQQLNPLLSGTDELAQLDRTFHDMAAALEEAARKERATTEYALDVICSVRTDGTFFQLNPACEQVWGYPRQELVDSSILNIVHHEDRRKTEEFLQELVSGRSKGTLENRVLARDGNTRDMLWSAHWSAAENTVFCVAHDMTDKKRLQELKRQFAAMIGHDLRAPMTSLGVTFELLLAGAYGELTPTGQHRMAKTQESLERLIRLLNDLLFLEKVEDARHLDLDLKPARLSQIVSEATVNLSALAERLGIQIIEPVEDHALTCDKYRIIQVLVNLISNALKFSPKGSKITIVAESDTDWIRIAVQDEGRGIPEHMIDSLFEKYKQVEAADASVKGGAGLGLTICKSIVEAHGGQIGVISRQGYGSTFWFTLPVIPEAREDGDVSSDRPAKVV